MTLRALLSRLAFVHRVTPPPPTMAEHRIAAWQGLTPRYRVTHPTNARYRLVPKFTRIDEWKQVYGS